MRLPGQRQHCCKVGSRAIASWQHQHCCQVSTRALPARHRHYCQLSASGAMMLMSLGCPHRQSRYALVHCAACLQASAWHCLHHHTQGAFLQCITAKNGISGHSSCIAFKHLSLPEIKRHSTCALPQPAAMLHAQQAHMQVLWSQHAQDWLLVRQP